ncbi:kinase [Caulobacter sp. KR2-114]|uniref:kinase n=1 Tax=Caulobacter sp. KR2-114 TaxID=3400912 RepID=UPI003C10E809
MFEALLAEEGLPSAYLATIAAVHAPLADAIADVARQARRPVIIGLCGAQGSGKSTTAKVLARLLEAKGLAAAVLSLDDLYLSHAARQDLARRVHPLLATRGPPGTHDVAQGRRILQDVLDGRAVRLPRFDKAADDPAPPADWAVVGPLDVLIFEGWCVGARPQDPHDLVQPVNALEREADPEGVWRRWCNDALAGDYQPLFALIDRLVLLRAPGFEVVRRWRGEQEAKLRQRAGAGMSEAAIDRFIQHYERLTRHILARMPAYADAVIDLGGDREPLGVAGALAP